MTMFWIVAALFLLGALLMLLPALLRPQAGQASGAVAAAGANLAVHRDQWREAERELALGLLSPERFEQARQDIRHRVLEEGLLQEGIDAPVATVATVAVTDASRSPPTARRTAWLLALLLPLATVLTYLGLGNPEAIAPSLAAVPAGDRHSLTPEQIQKMVAALAERLQARPDDAEGWQMLGRSYTALGRYRDAATALRRAVDLLPPDATLLADLADVTGMAQGKRLAGEPARLVQQALDIDPRHVKALALAGSVAFEARDFGNARAHWQRLLAVVPAESTMARSIQGSIAEASAREQQADGSAPRLVATGTAPGAQTANATAKAAPADPAPGPGGRSVQGQVVVSPALAERVAAGDVLFVFARAAQGPRMPVAIQRLAASRAPQAFVLDDSMAMSPNAKLSGQAQVVVSARISRSGNATPQPGDLVGEGVVAVPGTEGLRIVIDQVRP